VLNVLRQRWSLLELNQWYGDNLDDRFDAINLASEKLQTISGETKVS
jgi:hypothetical protein